MPEQPELDAATGHLRTVLGGRRVEHVEIAAISVLKTAAPPSALAGRTIGAIRRRGKHLLIDVEGQFLVVHLALAGWLRHHAVSPAPRPGPRAGPLALRIVLDDGSAVDVTEQGTRKSVGVWVSDQPDQLETLTRLGPEASELDGQTFAQILSGTGSQLKTVLTDQRVMAGIGNAWSDEILHRARLSPFAAANRQDRRSAAGLHAAMTTVLSEATEQLAGVGLGRLKTAKKKLLAIHGRAGSSCPVCGDTIAEVSYADRSLQYCPSCQTRGRRLNDRRMDRLLR